MSKWASNIQIKKVLELFQHSSDVTIMRQTGLTKAQVRYIAKKFGLVKSKIRLTEAHRPQAEATNAKRWNKKKQPDNTEKNGNDH